MRSFIETYAGTFPNEERERSRLEREVSAKWRFSVCEFEDGARRFVRTGVVKGFYPAQNRPNPCGLWSLTRRMKMRIRR